MKWASPISLTKFLSLDISYLVVLSFCVFDHVKKLVEFLMKTAAGRLSNSTSPSDIEFFPKKTAIFAHFYRHDRKCRKWRFYRKKSRRSLVGRIPLSRGKQLQHLFWA